MDGEGEGGAVHTLRGGGGVEGEIVTRRGIVEGENEVKRVVVWSVMEREGTGCWVLGIRIEKEGVLCAVGFWG